MISWRYWGGVKSIGVESSAASIRTVWPVWIVLLKTQVKAGTGAIRPPMCLAKPSPLAWWALRKKKGQGHVNGHPKRHTDIPKVLARMCASSSYLVSHKPWRTVHACRSDSGSRRSLRTRSARRSCWGHRSATWGRTWRTCPPPWADGKCPRMWRPLLIKKQIQFLSVISR